MHIVVFVQRRTTKTHNIVSSEPPQVLKQGFSARGVSACPDMRNRPNGMQNGLTFLGNLLKFLKVNQYVTGRSFVLTSVVIVGQAVWDN